MGQLHSLDHQARALGRALALNTGVSEARSALLERSNEHALLDITGIIAWHACISKVVDMSGFYSNKILVVVGKVAQVAIFCRRCREILWLPMTLLVTILVVNHIYDIKRI